MVVWHVLTDAASPYAAIGGLVGVQIPNIVLVVLTVSFALEHMALEVYHFPRIFKPAAHQVLYQFPWLKHLPSDEALRPKAERRAAKLRTQLDWTSVHLELRYEVVPTSVPPQAV